MAYQDAFKQGFTGLDPVAALQQPAASLLGVSAEAATTLGKLGIATVFDLATAPVFDVAREIAEMAEGRGTSAMARLGLVPGGLLDAGLALAPDALAAAPVGDLQAVDEALAAELTGQLQVTTIGELGRWPAFRAARDVLGAATTTPDAAADDAEELVPRLGEFPTERRFYQSIVVDHVAAGATTDLATAGPIDIAPATGPDSGFAAPAVGARMTFVQSWFAHGVALGNLLHSVALAPGESTRIAMLDWSRQTSASAAEDVSQAEQLTQATSHNRAVSEVQDAVAQEAQSGFSRTHAESGTASGGGGLGLSLGPLTIGGSGSGSSTTSDANSFSASTGSRQLAASMSQNVMDSTQQAASSVRNRRASIVKEVSEQEHEEVSTRIVANYNHMHALTVQYFEVVELYRVSAHLHQVERCLFVPMRVLEFDDGVVARYRAVLADAALDQHIRELLTTEYGVVLVHPVAPVRRPIDVFGHLADLQVASVAARPMAAVAVTGGAGTTSSGVNAPGDGAASPVASDAGAPAAWSAEEMARASRLIGAGPARPGTSDLFLPNDAELVGVSFSSAAVDGAAVPISAVQVRLRSGEARDLAAAGPVDWSLATPVPLQDLEDVRVSSAATGRFDGRITLQLSYHGARFPLTAPLGVGAQAALAVVLTIGAPESGAELLEHLQQHRMHYSEAVWGALGASDIQLLLWPFTFESLPVADLIDPNPLMIAGNYLVFRMPGFTRTAGLPEHTDGAAGSDAEAAIRKSWDAWLAARGLVLGAEAAAEELVSIPTGGVFAEAVLGRSNSAELLDARRFWNWQDSPIPLQPPEVAAIQLESRAQPEDVTPGQLAPPVVNITNPTALPDPTGLGPMLAALQNGNMFRDMSGLAATVGLAQALGQATSTAATEAGRQAAANLAVAAQKDIEEKRIAAQLALAAMGAGAAGGGAGTPKNITESGALLNTAKALDAQAPRGGSPPTGSGAPPAGGGASHAGGSGGGPLMPGATSSPFTTGSESRADDALRRALWGTMGVPGADIVSAAFTPSDGSGRAGAQATAVDVVAPFPEGGGYLTVVDTGDAGLTNCVAAVEQDADVKDLCGAVVDVSGDLPRAAMYGLNSSEMLYVGSLAKLYAMYVAFELRLRVEAQAQSMIAHGLATTGAGWEQPIFSALRTAWQPQLTAKFPGLPVGFPALGTIFSVSTSGDVSFTQHQPALTDAELDTIGENGSPDTLPADGSPLFFRDWMRLMLRWSNNAAASRCIRALSYPYINGALTDAGFFDPHSKSGLWLSGDYQGHDWLPSNKAGQPLTPRWAAAQARATSNFTGTSLQVARLMTLLAQGRLIDTTSSAEMRGILNAADGGIGSYVDEGLASAAPPRQSTTIRSKIGLGDDGFSHDGAIVYVGGPDPDMTLTYVSVALGSPPAKLREDLHKLVVKFHDCVVARH